MGHKENPTNEELAEIQATDARILREAKSSRATRKAMERQAATEARTEQTTANTPPRVDRRKRGA